LVQDRLTQFGNDFAVERRVRFAKPAHRCPVPEHHDFDLSRNVEKACDIDGDDSAPGILFAAANLDIAL